MPVLMAETMSTKQGRQKQGMGVVLVTSSVILLPHQRRNWH